MSKGGSTSSTVEVPQYIEDAARRNLTQADKIRRLGYIPEYGPTVAALTPLQETALQNTAQAAGAFGLPGGGMSQQDIMGGMPEPTTYAGGVRGYSSLPIYEQALEAFGQARPGQKEYAESFFIDPVTGLPGSNMQAPVDYTVTPAPGDLGGISAGGGAGVVAGGGGGVSSGSTLTDAEIADYSQIIANSVGLDTFDPTRTAESQMTPEQYAAYQSQSMSDPAQLAADDIYMSNLATSGQGSLATGGMTGTTFGGDVAAGLNAVSNIPSLTGLLANEAAEAMAPRNVYRDTDNSNRTAMETQLDYQAAQRASGLASGAIPAFDPNDPSTFILPSGQNAQEAFQEASTTPVTSLATSPISTPAGTAYVNTYSGGFESRPAHATDNDREFDAFYDTKIKDPLSGKMLSPFQLSNRLQPGSLGAQYADIGITSLDQILDPTPPPPPQPVSTSAPASGVSETTGMEVRSLPNGTEYFVDASGNFAGLK